MDDIRNIGMNGNASNGDYFRIAARTPHTYNTAVVLEVDAGQCVKQSVSTSKNK